MTWELVIDGIDFGEGPRWQDGRLWFSDFYQHSISSVGDDGERRIELGDAGRPSGLGWLPDGRLLFVSMQDRRIMRQEADGTIVEHADLSSLANGHCNDMVVDTDGTAYVGNFGFDFEKGEPPAPTQMIVVRPDGSAVADDHPVMFPNGSVILDRTLIVGESFASRYTAFTIADDGSLTDPRVWAEAEGTAPDGCTIDADGAIWFSDAMGSQLVRIDESGVLDTLATPNLTFACMLGGEDGRTLFALTCSGSHPDECSGTGTGALYKTRVDVPRHPSARQ